MKNDKSISSFQESEWLEEEFPDYDHIIPWTKSYEGVNFFEWFNNSRSHFISKGQSTAEHIYFFQNESTFAFRVSSQVLNISLRSLWNYWKDVIKENGYALKNSEKLKKKEGIIFRYYLKPKLKYKVDGNQLFGNITLEYMQNDGKNDFILLKCTWYSDRSFKAPDDYGGLLELIGR